MKKSIYPFIIGASLCASLISCESNSKSEASLNVISVAEAYSSPTKLKASECFRKIRYIPLETTDSCLVGSAPSIQIVGNKLIVSTLRQKQCFLFDKQTGRFISSVGHAGNDPQGYSSTSGWLNEANGRIYFPAGSNKLKYVSYDLDGKFAGDFTMPMQTTGFFSIPVFSDLDAHQVVGYYPASKEGPDRLIVLRDTTVTDTFTVYGEEQKLEEDNPNDIESMSVINKGTAGTSVILVTYKGGEKQEANAVNTLPLWHVGKDLFFKGVFNDTIYQVTTKGLHPVRVFDYGTYRWDLADRNNPEKDQAIYPTTIYENDQVILFRFITHLFHQDKRTGYNALFNKSTGVVKVGLYDEGIQDDLTNFMVLQPTFVSSAGEFAAILPADKIVNWFEENGGTDNLPDEVKALKKLGEEDNPVVVIME